MDKTTANSVREELIKSDEKFKSLVQKHEEYEKRLNELTDLTYPNDEELIEETELKKKKLLIKDQIHSKITEYSTINSN